MAADEFNSLGGYSVNIPPIAVIDENGNVVTNVLVPAGNVAAANVYAANYYYANGLPFNAGGNPYGPNDSVQFNSNGAFGGIANFTFNAGNQLLRVPSITVAGLSNLGNLGNITITGGNAGYLLTTSGNGVLNWTPPSTGSAISNGTSNLNIDTVNGNIVAGVNGVANVFSITSQGVITSGNVTAGNVKTDNLLYANGVPYVFTTNAAGSNTQVQFNNNNAFSASANFTFDNNTNTLTVTNIVSNGAGLSNITGANVTGQVGYAAVANSVAVANVVGIGNIATINLDGNVSNVLRGDGTWGAEAGNLNANFANFAGNVTGSSQPNITSLGTLVDLNVAGNANINGNLVTQGTIVSNANITGANLITSNGIYANTATITANLTSGNANLGNLATANYVNVSQQLNGNVANFSGNLTSLNANLGNLVTANYVNVSSNTITNNLTVNLELSGNTANFTGNITSLNANLGNLATANYINALQQINGNVANFSGNLTALNANLGNLVTANYVNVSSNLIVSNLTVNLELSGNTANFSGNITALNTTLGNLATANYINVSQQLNGNVANFSGNLTSLNANLGNLATANFIQTNEIFNGNSNVRIASNGNVTVSVTGTSNVYTLSNVGANIVGYVSANGDGTFGAVNSNTVTAQGGNLTLYAAAGNNYVELRPTGTGHIDVGNFKIQNLGAPTSSSDAATKQYVDDIAQGLHVHAPCFTAGNDTLAILTGGTITYNNGTAGVGANLVLSGSPTANYLSANCFDGNVTAVVGSRILVYKQLNLAHNGIYVVDSATVLTRATDFDTPTEMAGGDFTFVQNGDDYNDTGWVMTDPVTIVGTSPVIFVQFSGAGTYQAGQGLTLTGTVFSVNVDNVTTEIAGGNVVVKANAQLTTPNIGAATGTSINLTGNVLANNINANTKITSFDIEVSNNIVTSNATINLELSGNTANFIGNIKSLNANLGNLAIANYFQGDGGLLTNVSATGSLANGTSNVSIPSVNGNVNISVNGNANILTVTGTGANLTGTLNVTGLVTVSNTAGGATAIAMGDPTQGNLISNAVTLTNSSSVSNAIAQLNVVLGKLVPPSPPTFPAGQSIAVQTLSTYRMANFTQTDNTPGANKSVAGGTTVTNVRRASSYVTGNITVAGPGDTGTITAFLNGSDAGNRTLTSSLNGNGTYSNLVIFNNYDYNVANANIQAGFWSVFSSRAAGTVTEGWNEVYIADSAASNTNTANWYYDSSTPGTPAFSSLTISPPGSPSYTYSSTVPHYTNTNIFTLTANVNRLSGNMYPTSDSFVTGTSGGAFGTPSSVTYSAAGVTTPLAQNLYVSSGNASISTTSTIISGFGASSTGPSLSSNNSYNSATQAFTSTLAANVLYKTGTVSSASTIEEANVFVGSTIGTGSGLAFRIINPGSADTPVYTANAAAFNSQSSTLQTYDSTVVANILKHDQTNYSTGYLPTGPNLSSGRSGSQYFTFKIIRTSVSKFDVKWTGTIAGLWVALPGSVIDSTSSANGWIDMSIAYAGAGIPGVNSPGNGSNGCALGGVAPLNSAQTNKSITATFGTVSSSSTATSEIYIRIKLTSGQSVTALSLQTASN
jgi:hypothetical protein